MGTIEEKKGLIQMVSPSRMRNSFLRDSGNGSRVKGETGTQVQIPFKILLTPNKQSEQFHHISDTPTPHRHLCTKQK
jgi:hypothetical protein